MSIKDRINQDLKEAMRSRDQKKVAALRFMTAAIKQVEVDERVELDDARILALLDKMSKQRMDAIEQYQKASRDDLVEQETYELELIKTFLPEPLSESEINALITEAFYETGAASMRDMGKIMAYLKPIFQGRADMGVVSALIKDKLQ